MSAPSFSEDQYKTDTMNPIKAQAVPSAPPAVKGSYRSVSQGYDNVPDIEIGAGDAVDAHGGNGKTLLATAAAVHPILQEPIVQEPCLLYTSDAADE